MSDHLREKVERDAEFLRGLLLTDAPRERIERVADAHLAQVAHQAFLEKLEASRAKGRGGWWRDDECTIASLRALLVEHLDKGDYVDVMIFAAMVAFREIADAAIESEG